MADVAGDADCDRRVLRGSAEVRTGGLARDAAQFGADLCGVCVAGLLVHTRAVYALVAGRSAGALKCPPKAGDAMFPKLALPRTGV